MKNSNPYFYYTYLCVSQALFFSVNNPRYTLCTMPAAEGMGNILFSMLSAVFNLDWANFFMDDPCQKGIYKFMDVPQLDS